MKILIIHRFILVKSKNILKRKQRIKSVFSLNNQSNSTVNINTEQDKNESMYK